jgi:hypothetical protein
MHHTMGYVPGFANDIFISYSHIDNQALEGTAGWVTEFHQLLQIEVEEVLGDRIHIWRDARIGPADDFSRDLDRQVRDSAMLLAVLSPGYRGSAWCEREAKGFVSGAHREGDLWVGTKCRVIKIVKRPAEVNLLPETGALEFFEMDQASGRPYELEPRSRAFNRLLSDLALEIGDVLRAMRRSRSVFLGHASPPLAMQRDRVKRELQARDYRVVTAARSSAGEAQDVVRNAIQECSLAVLFDSHGEGEVEGPADALARDERAVATEEGARQLVVLRGQQSLGIDHDVNVELMPDPSQHALNHTMLQMLQAPEAARTPKRLVRVYLVCDRQDHPLLQPNRARDLRDFLMQCGLEVKMPLAEESEAAEFSRDNRSKLKQCDAVLLYWGSARQSWFDQRLAELMQARGWRRGREFVAVAAYIADPENPVKKNYQTREVDELIKQFDGVDFTDARFARFVQRLTVSV